MIIYDLESRLQRRADGLPHIAFFHFHAPHAGTDRFARIPHVTQPGSAPLNISWQKQQRRPNGLRCCQASKNRLAS